MDKFNFKEVLARMNRVKKELPTILANDAKNDFLNNFRQQGFEGKKWQEVKRRIPTEKAYKGRKDPGKRTRAILQGKGSGRLRVAVANSLKQATWDKILFIVQTKYARVHNDGGVAGRTHFRMPQRQYIGGRQLQRKLSLKAKKVIDTIWKG